MGQLSASVPKGNPTDYFIDRRCVGSLCRGSSVLSSLKEITYFLFFTHVSTRGSNYTAKLHCNTFKGSIETIAIIITILAVISWKATLNVHVTVQTEVTLIKSAICLI